MISDAKNVLMLKILVSLAWADRKIDAAERELITSFGRKLGLSDESQETIAALLNAPQDPEDAALLLRDFVHGTLNRQERRDLIGLMEELAQVDGEVSPAEQELIDQVRRTQEFGSPLGLLRQAVRGDNQAPQTRSKPS